MANILYGVICRCLQQEPRYYTTVPQQGSITAQVQGLIHKLVPNPVNVLDTIQTILYLAQHSSHWHQVLELDPVNCYDGFFPLSGARLPRTSDLHSIDAVQQCSDMVYVNDLCRACTQILNEYMKSLQDTWVQP